MKDDTIARQSFATKRMVWLPVRCCCTPDKIFGFLHMGEADARRGSIEIDGRRVEIRSISNFAARTFRISAGDEPVSFETELAVYSDDRPREFWRGLPGFVEARN